MRAAVLSGFGEPLSTMEVDRPKAGPGQVLIKLEASGVCHTDVHIWLGHSKPVFGPRPFILGHEGVGTVVGIGDGVDDWKIGDRVGAAWTHSTCGKCDECADGEENFCQQQSANGFDFPGTFAEYTVVDGRFAARLPDGDPALLAPLMCAGLTAYGAIQRAEVKVGETCAIFGCGGLGLYAIQLAARVGANVIAVDVDDAKLETATRLGAVQTINTKHLSGIGWPSGNEAHVCINFAPTPHTWPLMKAAIKPRGRIIAAAMVAQPVAFDQEWLTFTGVRITGTSVGTRKQMNELLHLHACSPLICETERISLEDVTRALTALKNGTARGRYCIQF
ncbi:MAG: alcohol dehydrogenase catalytic domain-containing protein [Rhizobiaceae bacterium]